MADLFAPPTEDELKQTALFAPPTPEELESTKDLFAPPTKEELASVGLADQPSKLEAFGRGAAQGATMGWADEITAGFEAALTEKPYKQALAESRGAYEKAAKAHPKTTLAGEVTGGIASALIPGMQVAGVAKGASLVKTAVAATKAGAIYGGIEGAGRSVAEDTKELLADTAKGAGIGAAFSLGIGVAGKGLHMAKKSLSDKTMKFLSEQDLDITNGARKIIQGRAAEETMLKEALTNPSTITDPKLIQDQTKFGSFLAGKSVGQKKSAELIKKAIDEGDFESKLAIHRRQEAMLDYIDKEATETLADTIPGIRKFMNLFTDSQFVYQQIDDRLGTELQPTLNALSAADRRVKTEIARLNNTHMKSIRKLLRTSDVDEGRLFQALDKGKLEGISKTEQEIVTRVRAMTNDMLETYKQAGMPVKMRENYFPSKMVDIPEYINRIDAKVKSVIGQHADEGMAPNKWLRSLDEDDVSALANSSDDFMDLLDGLAMGQSRAKSGTEILSQLQAIRNPVKTANRLQTQADALFLREDLIPDFLRDTNVESVLFGSAYNNLKHAYMRDGLAELGAHIPVLRKLGDDTSAEYIARHITDITGRRSTLFGDLAHNASLKWRAKMGQLMQDTEDKTVKSVLGVARDMPAFMSSMTNNVYANFLGLNTKAFVRNLTQPYVMTSAHLTGNNPLHIGRAVKYALRGSAETAKDMRGGMSYARMKKNLVAQGYAPPKYTAEARTALERAVRSSTPASMVAEGYETLTNKMMVMYEASDIINRNTTLHMAKQLAKDFAAGDDIAKAMIERMGRGYQSRIARAKTPEELEHLIADNLLSTTQFNYDRVSLSEFGRMMGPLFSMFTKWPTSIAGDIIATMSNKNSTQLTNASKVFMKYGGPLVAAMAMDATLGEPTDPRGKKMIGSGGFSSWMPINSLQSITGGDIMTPPLVQSGGELFRAVGSDKPGALAKWLNDTSYAFGPGMGLARFFGEDIPALLDNKEEGDLVYKLLREK